MRKVACRSDERRIHGVGEEEMERPRDEEGLVQWTSTFCSERKREREREGGREEERDRRVI